MFFTVCPHWGTLRYVSINVYILYTAKNPLFTTVVPSAAVQGRTVRRARACICSDLTVLYLIMISLLGYYCTQPLGFDGQGLRTDLRNIFLMLAISVIW